MKFSTLLKTTRNYDEISQNSQPVKTAQLRAVQGVGVPLQGVYINVHNQNGTDYDTEMRRKYVVLLRK